MLRKKRKQNLLLHVYGDHAEKVTSIKKQELLSKSESMSDEVDEDETYTAPSSHKGLVEKKDTSSQKKEN